jgi:hypothetical protein
VNQITMNSSTAENFARSAKAPTIRPQVIAAKAPWKMTKISSEMTTPLLKGGGDRIRRDALQEELVEAPKKALPSVKATSSRRPPTAR